MEAEQFINSAATELEMVEAQLRDVEARAAALRARGDGLRFVIQYGQESQRTELRAVSLAGHRNETGKPAVRDAART
jgi:hypothetical protein